MVKVYNMNNRWEYQNLRYDPFKHCSHQGSIFLEISSYRTEEVSYFHPYYTAYLEKSISCILVSSLVLKRVCWLLLCVKKFLKLRFVQGYKVVNGTLMTGFLLLEGRDIKTLFVSLYGHFSSFLSIFINLFCVMVNNVAI